MTNNVLLIFVKNLIEGQVKTRLAATIGNEAAMNIYKQLLQKVHHTVQSFEADKIVFYSDFIVEDIWHNKEFQKKIQKGIDLGERMGNAFINVFERGYVKAVIIGTDCPEINKNVLENAFTQLNNFDIVIGPATDGGYYLLGMKKNYPELFEHIEWSKKTVFGKTIAVLNRLSLKYYILPELNDIDEENDLKYLKNSE